MEETARLRLLDFGTAYLAHGKLPSGSAGAPGSSCCSVSAHITTLLATLDQSASTACAIASSAALKPGGAAAPPAPRGATWFFSLGRH